MDNKVKEIRVKKGLSQEELANKSNISRYLISKIENGEDVNLTKNTMISISKALEKPVVEVFILWVETIVYIKWIVERNTNELKRVSR